MRSACKECGEKEAETGCFCVKKVPPPLLETDGEDRDNAGTHGPAAVCNAARRAGHCPGAWGWRGHDSRSGAAGRGAVARSRTAGRSGPRCPAAPTTVRRAAAEGDAAALPRDQPTAPRAADMVSSDPPLTGVLAIEVSSEQGRHDAFIHEIARDPMQAAHE